MEWFIALLKNRVARFAAFVLVPVLALLWWQLGGAPGEVVESGAAQAVVVEIHPHAYLVALDDGRRVRVYRTRKLVQGERVTLTATRYESGLTQYTLPAEREASP